MHIDFVLRVVSNLAVDGLVRNEQAWISRGRTSARRAEVEPANHTAVGSRGGK